MKCFVFDSQWESVAFEYLIENYPDQVKSMLDEAQREAADACTSDELNLSDIHPDYAVFERLGSKLQDWFDEDGLESMEYDTLYHTMLSSALNDLNYNTIAAAIFYGVEPGSDPRRVALREIPNVIQ